MSLQWRPGETRVAFVESSSEDWLFSHSCLEHVDGVAAALQATFGWLRPGGVMTHEVDHRSHNLTRNWDGHWDMHEAVWRVLRGRRHYLINRLPQSIYLVEIRRLGFAIEADVTFPRDATVTPLPRFQLVQSDRRAATSFVLARKPLAQAQH